MKSLFFVIFGMLLSIANAQIPIDSVKKVYPNTAKIVKMNTIWNKAIDEKSKLLGYVLSSESYGTKIFGYMENTPLLIITDPKQTIKKVFLYNHAETPFYVNLLTKEKFLDRYIGIKLSALSTHKVDAVSGATFTSKAIVETAKLVGKKVGENPIK